MGPAPRPSPDIPKHQGSKDSGLAARPLLTEVPHTPHEVLPRAPPPPALTPHGGRVGACGTVGCWSLCLWRKASLAPGSRDHCRPSGIYSVNGKVNGGNAGMFCWPNRKVPKSKHLQRPDGPASVTFPTCRGWMAPRGSVPGRCPTRAVRLVGDALVAWQVRPLARDGRHQTAGCCRARTSQARVSNPAQGPAWDGSLCFSARGSRGVPASPHLGELRGARR